MKSFINFKVKLYSRTPSRLNESRGVTDRADGFLHQAHSTVRLCFPHSTFRRDIFQPVRKYNDRLLVFIEM